MRLLLIGVVVDQVAEGTASWSLPQSAGVSLRWDHLVGSIVLLCNKRCLPSGSIVVGVGLEVSYDTRSYLRLASRVERWLQAGGGMLARGVKSCSAVLTLVPWR